MQFFFCRRDNLVPSADPNMYTANNKHINNLVTNYNPKNINGKSNTNTTTDSKLLKPAKCAYIWIKGKSHVVVGQIYYFMCYKQHASLSFTLLKEGLQWRIRKCHIAFWCGLKMKDFFLMSHNEKKRNIQESSCSLWFSYYGTYDKGSWIHDRLSLLQIEKGDDSAAHTYTQKERKKKTFTGPSAHQLISLFPRTLMKSEMWKVICTKRTQCE